MTPMYLDLSATSTFEEWRQQGMGLELMFAKVSWLIGDWIDAGARTYGTKAHEEANRIFRRFEKKLDPAVKVCQRFPAEVRRPALTFEHYLAVLPIGDLRREEAMLAEAETHGLTAPMLKAKIKIEEGARQPSLPDDDPEDAAYRRLVHAWNLSPMSAREALMEEVEDKGMGVIEL